MEYDFGGVFLEMDLHPIGQSIIKFINKGYPCTLFDEKSIKSTKTDEQVEGQAISVSSAVLICRRQHRFFKLVLDLLARFLDEIRHESNEFDASTWKKRRITMWNKR